MEEQVVQTKKPRPRYEWVIIAVVMVAAIVLGFGINAKRDELNKGRALIAELTNLRSAVMLYKTLNKANPPSLDALTKLNYSLQPGQPAKPYLTNVKPGPNGQISDPFGNTYKYDGRTGWVVSVSRGYEKW